MPRPAITVGFPVYNGARFLRGALDSLLAQDHPSFEIVISDNGSTDETRLICEEYASADRRIRLLANDVNRGAAWNFNNVVHHASGQYFMWAAHDDLWRSDCLSRYADALDRDAEAVLVYCRATTIGSMGQPVGEPCRDFANLAASRVERFERVLEHWEMHCAIYGMFRTAALRRTRLIRNRVSCDVILLAEVALLGKTLELDEPLSMKRVPDPGTTYRNRDEQLDYLDPKRKRSPARFTGFFVTAESIRYALAAELTATERVACATSAVRAYATRWLSVDVKEEVIRQLSDHPNLLRRMRALSRRRR